MYSGSPMITLFRQLGFDKVWSISLSWERISRYHTSLVLKCERVTGLIWISVFGGIQNWNLITSLPQNPLGYFFISFRDVKAVLFCIGLKGGIFLSIVSNTRICCVNLQKLHLRNCSFSSNETWVKMLFPLNKYFFIFLFIELIDCLWCIVELLGGKKRWMVEGNIQQNFQALWEFL